MRRIISWYPMNVVKINFIFITKALNIALSVDVNPSLRKFF